MDYSLLPPCCNSGCTVCVLDYPELFIGAVDEKTVAMLEAIEIADEQAAQIEEKEWTNKEKMNLPTSSAHSNRD